MLRLILRKNLFIGMSIAILMSGLISSGQAEEIISWKTDKAKVLDDDEFYRVTYKVTKGSNSSLSPTDYNRTADEINELVLAELKDQKGVHIETALTTLGALAGFSAQMGVRETAIKSGEVTEKQVFIIIETKTKETFYLGEPINEMLFAPREGNLSIWSLVGGAAQRLGTKELMDMTQLVQHVSATLGSEKFGVPRLPLHHMPQQKPIRLLNKFWNPIRNHLVLNAQTPLEWPLILGLAAQKLILLGKDEIDPGLASKIVMESVVPMAKVDPKTVRYAYYLER